jgi:hypothetical protein
LDPLPFVSLGLIDGLNICSLGLLGLFLSLMYATQTDRRTILGYGAVYVGSVFLSYLMVGVGATLLFITLPAVPHFLARIAAAGMLAIGMANIVNYFRPGTIPLRMESASQAISSRAVRFMKVGGMPAVFAAGILIGFHNFPCACTGGVYITFLSLIADSPLKMAYLLAYNLVFIIPLTAILLVSSSRQAIVQFRKMHARNAAKTTLLLGVVMAALGVLLLIAIGVGVQ